MFRFIMLKCSEAVLRLNFMQWQECLMLCLEFHYKVHCNVTPLSLSAEKQRASSTEPLNNHSPPGFNYTIYEI